MCVCVCVCVRACMHACSSAVQQQKNQITCTVLLIIVQYTYTHMFTTYASTYVHMQTMWLDAVWIVTHTNCHHFHTREVLFTDEHQVGRSVLVLLVIVPEERGGFGVTGVRPRGGAALRTGPTPGEQSYVAYSSLVGRLFVWPTCTLFLPPFYKLMSLVCSQ